MKVCTWNTQGDPTQDEGKNAVLRRLYDENDILFLQECGRLQHINIDQNHLCVVEQAGAFNIRCSTCVITKFPVHFGHFLLPSGTGRSCIFFVHDGIAYATLHAESGGAAMADVNYVIKQMQGNRMQYVIGGDMNCTPLQLSRDAGHRSLWIGTQNRGIPAAVSSPQANTHPSSMAVLDYFVHSQNLVFRNTQRYFLRGNSDHFPVITEF